MKKIIKAAAWAILTIAIPTASHASLFTADFSGQINPGSANVKAPFIGSFASGDPITGHFVFDSAQVPGSGAINVPISGVPNYALIPASTAFQFTLDGISFTAGDNLSGLNSLAVQYQNGHFNGFTFLGD